MALFGSIAATILCLVGLTAFILLAYGVINPRSTAKFGFIKTRKHVLLTYIPALLVFMTAGVFVQKTTRPPKLEPVLVVEEADPAAELRLAEQIAQLEAEAKAIPVHDSQANIDAYSRLLGLDPGNLQYQAKVVHYQAQLERQMASWDAQATRQSGQSSRSSSTQSRQESKHGKRPNVNALDNSVYEVKFYLQKVVEKPGTLLYDKWTDVEYSAEEGWLVSCDWLAKDQNNEYIRTRNTFVIRDGKVVEVR